MVDDNKARSALRPRYMADDLLAAALAGDEFLLFDGAMAHSSRLGASPPASCRSCSASSVPTW